MIGCWWWVFVCLCVVGVVVASVVVAAVVVVALVAMIVMFGVLFLGHFLVLRVPCMFVDTAATTDAADV